MLDILIENPVTRNWVLLVPGIVILFVRSQFVTTRIASNAENLISYLAVSLIYHALALPFLDMFVSHNNLFVGGMFAWFLYILIIPVFFGLAIGINIQKNFVRRALQGVGLNPVHAIPTAWDWKFGRMVTGEWVLVTLKNGTRFAGFCGPESFMSSEPDERDLYIQWVYDLDDEDSWRSRGETGLLVAGGEISTIEFWPYKLEEGADEQK